MRWVYFIKYQEGIKIRGPARSRNLNPELPESIHGYVKRLGTSKRKILRSIYGPVAEQGIWKTRTNQELRELYKDLDTVVHIKKNRLQWIGHVARMDQGRTVKKVLESKSEGNRRRGRAI